MEDICSRQDALARATDVEIVASQIKAKFGTLHFQLSEYLPGSQDIVTAGEHKSCVTCERCGAPGSVRMTEHWVSTRCDRCHAQDLIDDGAAASVLGGKADVMARRLASAKALLGEDECIALAGGAIVAWTLSRKRRRSR
ncbi:hypothetical protein [Zavarzinia compransoris]|uniref:Transposase n=1 Tax=Zavarzinia compransoris TaxID=1264899 RepID=A0A317DZN4_9PROT|nr:hypothetical protein [Zavarzinia compransoris]PWR18355.1 hypothetical protein DKG75_20545 [Zavarzinia compransoris]